MINPQHDDRLFIKLQFQYEKKNICSVHVVYIKLGFVLKSITFWCTQHVLNRNSSRFFDQVSHQKTYAYIKNKHFFTKSCHCQTYQSYEQPPQSLQKFILSKSFLSIKFQQNLWEPESFWIFFSLKNIRLGNKLLKMKFFENFDF